MINMEALLFHLHGDERVQMRRVEHHDAAQHDIERSFAKGRLFRCDACADEILVVQDERAPTEEHGQR